MCVLSRPLKQSQKPMASLVVQARLLGFPFFRGVECGSRDCGAMRKLAMTGNANHPQRLWEKN